MLLEWISEDDVGVACDYDYDCLRIASNDLTIEMELLWFKCPKPIKFSKRTPNVVVT